MNLREAHIETRESSAAFGASSRRLTNMLYIGALLVVCALCVMGDLRFDDVKVITAAVFVTSIMSAIVGFSFAAIGGAALGHLANHPLAIPGIMTLCGLANQAAMTWAMRAAVDWRSLRGILVSGLLGVPLGLGIWILSGRHVDARPMGIVMLAFGFALPGLRHLAARRLWPGLEFAAGFIGGIIGGILEFPGASVAIWCNLKDRDKTRQRAIFQPFMLILLVPIVVTMGLAGGDKNHVMYVALADLRFVPAGLLGTAIGLACFRRMSDRQFSVAVSLQLIMSGLGFIAM